MALVNRSTAAAVAVSVLLVACSASEGGLGPGTSSSEPPPGAIAETAFPSCGDVPDAAAPEDWYRDTPVYVGNEQPVEDVRAWASGQPGYVNVGVDRARNGWIWVAFTEGVEQRQVDLESTFPGVGVVAVEAAHSNEELAELQVRVNDRLMSRGWAVSTGYGNAKHILMVHLGLLSEERLAALDEFRGEPICVEGADPATAVPDGPQPSAGQGWRLLGEDLVGAPYRTGVATDADQYAALWSLAGLAGPAPEVDFETEIVVWFGAVYGSSCPIRLDDVVIDTERALVHGEFVVPGNPPGCSSDARPHSYVVAIERAALPAGPFAIQLDAADPPPGAPEERTVVNADLSVPGAVAAADQVNSGGVVQPE